LKTLKWPVFGLLLGTLFLTGCGEDESLDAYQADMETFFEDMAEYDENMNAIDVSQDGYVEQLLGYLDALDEEVAWMAELEVPDRFSAADSLADEASENMAEAVSCAYRFDRLVVAGATYDASLFPCMEDFLYHLKIKNFQNRKAAVVENGSWAPMAGKLMKAYLEGMKNVGLVGPVVTIKSVMNEKNLEELNALADALLE